MRRAAYCCAVVSVCTNILLRKSRSCTTHLQSLCSSGCSKHQHIDCRLTTSCSFAAAATITNTSSLQIRSTQKYWQMKEGTEVYDSVFAANRMVGVLGALDAVATTW
jgi:hypothetical protein